MGNFHRFIDEFNAAANELDQALSAVNESPASLDAVHRSRDRLVVSRIGDIPHAEIPEEQFGVFVGRLRDLYLKLKDLEAVQGSVSLKEYQEREARRREV